MRQTPKAITGFTAFLRSRGRIVLAITAILATVSIVGIFRLRIDTDFAVFMPAESSHVEAMQRVAKSFGDADQLIILAENSGSPEELRQLPEITKKLTGIDGLTAAESPVPPSVTDMSDDDISRLIERVEKLSGSPVLRRADGVDWTLIRCLVEPGADLRQVIREIRHVMDAGNNAYYLSGEPYLEATVFDYIFRILLTLPPAAILLMLTVFRLRIGSARATALSMIPAVIGALLTLGAVAWLSGGISIVTVLVPIFVIVLGSADGLHLTSHVMDELEAGTPSFEAVRNTLDTVGGAIIMTTLTTMAGFFSLLLINSPAIRELAVTASGGILLAGIATWFIVPTLLLHMKPLQRKKRNSESRIQDLLLKLIGPRSLIISAVLILLCIPGIFHLRANFSMIDVYKPSTEVRKSIDAVTRILGGSIPVYLVFETDDPYDTRVADAVIAFEERARDHGVIGSGMSAYGIIASASEALTGRPGYPSNELFAKRAASLVSRLNPSFLPSFFAEDGLARAVFFLKDLDDTTVKSFIDTAAEISAETGITLEAAGTAFVMQEMNSQILPQQFASLLLAAAVVFILITLSQKSFRVGLVATVPIIITLTVLFGVMGYAGLDVSVITGIMSGLTIGVGIDYAIHYTSMHRRTLRKGSVDPRKDALIYVATPITANAAGLAVGFTALAFSPLNIHMTLSILFWVTMIMSSFLSLTLLPTLLGEGKSQTDP